MPNIIDEDAWNLMMPPYPSTRVLEVAKVPPPPVMGEELDDAACARFMVLAYQGAYAHVFGKRCYAHRRGNIENSKFYKSIILGSRALRDLEIPPHQWAAWFLDTWKHYTGDLDGKASKGKARKPPTLHAVYSPKTINERKGWFGREAVNYGGGLMIFSPTSKDILRRYAAVRRKTIHIGRGEFLDTHEALDEMFPGGWESWYKKAVYENNQSQQTLQEMLDRGDYIWL